MMFVNEEAQKECDIERQQQPRRPWFLIDGSDGTYYGPVGGNGNAKENIKTYPSEKVLSEKLNNLSIEERTLGIHELHGVADDIRKHENPEQISIQLNEISESAAFFAAKDSNDDMAMTYQKALKMSPTYVRRIQLLCLRCEYYNTTNAARRLVSFFTFKKLLFGETKLVKDITLDDLEEEDIDCFAKQGCLQLLQQRDRAGRAIILMNGAGSAHLIGIDTWCRIYYYVNMAALRDPEIQIQGMVFILYAVGKKHFLSNRPSKLTTMWSIMPIRLVAVHVCYDNPLMDFGMRFLSHAMETKHLCRFRAHYGTYFECMYILTTFGIPKDFLPFDMATGELDLTAHHQWVAALQIREAMITMDDTSMGPRLETSIIDPDTTTTTTTVTCSTTTTTGFKSTTTTTSAATTTTTTTTNPLPEDTSWAAATCRKTATTPPPPSSAPMVFDSTKEIVVPGPMDIIMGKGRQPKSSVGYVRFRTVLDDTFYEYDNAAREDKMGIAGNVLATLTKMGCRFVRKSPNGLLEECHESESLEKICHTFRNIRLAKKQREKKQQQQQNGSATTTTTTSTADTYSNNPQPTHQSVQSASINFGAGNDHKRCFCG